MGLGRYPSEVRAIADELLLLLEAEYRAEAQMLLDTRGESAASIKSHSEADRALILLGESPSKREKRLSKMDNAEACLLILQARLLGLMAAQAMHFADRFEMVPGKSYRDAAKFAATEISSARFVPTLEEIIPFYQRSTLRESKPYESRRWRFDDEPE